MGRAHRWVLLGPGQVSPPAFDVEVTALRDRGRRLWEGRLLPRRGLEGAIVCLSRPTGQVLAIAGGREPRTAFNRVLDGRRQAGSTFKPFFFAAALEAGFTPGSLVRDEPIAFPNGYEPRNFENRFFGTVTLQEALAKSHNVSAIRLVQEVGLARSLGVVERFEVAGDGDPRWDLPREFPVVLGTSAVSPLELAAAYGAFGNGGLVRPPSTLLSLENAEGRPLRYTVPRLRRVVDETAAVGVLQMLMAVMTDGSGQRVAELLPPGTGGAVAGKTGTTTDARDAWFAGLTPNHIVVVWIGFDRPLPLGTSATGSSIAGPVWADYVSRLVARSGPGHREDLLPPGWVFEEPSLPPAAERYAGLRNTGSAPATAPRVPGVQIVPERENAAHNIQAARY